MWPRAAKYNLAGWGLLTHDLDDTLSSLAVDKLNMIMVHLWHGSGRGKPKLPSRRKPYSRDTSSTANLTSTGPGSILNRSSVGFVVDEVALGQVFLSKYVGGFPCLVLRHCSVLIHSSITDAI
jgi:hypothetical protein